MKATSLGRFVPYTIGACMLAALGGCGDDNNSNNDRAQNGPAQQETRDDQGSYRATLTPLNDAISGNSSGTAIFTVQGDIVNATVNMTGTPMRITHMQHINGLSACPNMANDSNKDGIVDVREGVSAYGPILVPLDGDLESQSGGMAEFPLADDNGNYAYNKSASLSRILADLLDTDQNTADAIVKLAPGDTINFSGRTVIVHGVPETVTLPTTVATLEGATPHATLPIACGKIEKVDANALMKEQQQQQQNQEQQQQNQQQQSTVTTPTIEDSATMPQKEDATNPSLPELEDGQITDEAEAPEEEIFETNI